MRLGFLVYGLSAREAIALARSAEEQGHGAIWLVEDCWDCGPLPVAAGCSVVTSTIEIGIGVVNPFVRHPSALAMDYLTLCELSRGRVILGVGAGARQRIEQMGIPYRRPLTATMETIEMIRSLMKGEEVTIGGEVHRAESIRLKRTCPSAGGIYMGAMARRSVETCGAIADGWIVSILQPLAYVKQARKWLLTGASNAGKVVGDIDIVQYVPFSCSKDRATARRIAKNIVAAELRDEMELYREQEVVLASFRDHLEMTTPEEYERVVRNLAQGMDPARAVPDKLVDELAISGSPHDCLDMMRRYRDMGVRGLGLLCEYGDIRNAATSIGELQAELNAS